jgi:hypothetical protein
MSTTNTDHFSLLASLVGLGIAIYAIVSQPVQVDSKRPVQTKSEQKKDTSQLAFARLWDDPFAVYPDAEQATMPSQVPPIDGDTLFLVVPVKSQGYEEDRENRVRTRYAIQRALIDQGFAAEPGFLMASLRLAPPEKLVTAEASPQQAALTEVVAFRQSPPSEQGVRVPVQFFIQRPLQARLFKSFGEVGFRSVAVIWLPDVYAWQRTDGETNRYLEFLVKALRHSIEQARPAGEGGNRADRASDKGARRRHDRWVFLGPSDSDGLAMYHKYPPCWEDRSADPYWVPENADLLIAPYRVTIAEPILEVLPGEKSLNPAPAEFKPLAITAPGYERAAVTVGSKTEPDKVPLRRLGNGDEIMCAELLRAIQNAGSLPPHPRTINVTIFAEWDSLSGRALAETFAALAAQGLSQPVSDPAFYPVVLNELEKSLLGHRPPLTVASGGRKVQVTVIPYLRGLDGASSLYRAYDGATSGSNAPNDRPEQGSKTRPAAIVEAAEGNTQFDYIRRLTRDSFDRNVPFWPQANRPDAIVIFGTDIYDKLVLLEFLRQQLRNCLYLTTDLDALYWHPHYLQFTRDLIVASAFPLKMSAGICCSEGTSNAICSPVEFRDSYQSALYVVVTRCLQQSQRHLKDVSLDFTPDSFLYRIGNTKPLPILAHSAATRSGDSAQSTFEAFFGGVATWVGGLLEPVTEGTSPFWPFVLQITVIVLGLRFLWQDLPRRTALCNEAGTELWKAAAALVPETERCSVQDFHRQIRECWEKLKHRKRGWQDALLKRIRRAPIPTVTSNLTYGSQSRLDQLGNHYIALLKDATIKLEVAELALCFLSDLFALRPPADESCPEEKQASNEQQCGCNLKFAREVQPFVDYVRCDLANPSCPSERAQPEENTVAWKSTLKIQRFLRRRFPDDRFMLVGAVLGTMFLAICIQPVPFLVGPTTHSYGWRIALWLVSVGALVVTFSLFHRTCYEQYRFRKLIEGLGKLVPQADLGVSNRQVAFLVAEGSKPVANLTIVPCALVFLIYASHLHALGGVPMAGELSVLLGLSMLVMLYAYTRLRRAALATRAEVVNAYIQEQADAARLITRLKSYADGNEPMQDDEESLVDELKTLIRATSTKPGKVPPGTIKARIKKQEFRKGLCDYLEAMIQRDGKFVKQVGEIRTGVLAPLFANPVLGALMIPVGGASGLTLLEWLVSNAR